MSVVMKKSVNDRINGKPPIIFDLTYRMWNNAVLLALKIVFCDPFSKAVTFSIKITNRQKITSLNSN